MDEKLYKPSGKVNFIGLLLLTLGVTLLGCILSITYLVLLSFIPFIYINVLLTLAFGMLLGSFSAKLIYKLKIRNTILCLLSILIACILFNYFKWNFYVYRDYQSLITGSQDTELAYDYYELYYDFDEIEDKDMQEHIKLMQNSTTYDYLGGDLLLNYYEEAGEPLEQSDIDLMKSLTYYQYWGYDKLLGNDPSAAADKIKRMKEMPYLQYHYKYVEPKDASLLLQPKALLEDIKLINQVGRWSYSYGSDSDGELVKGGILAFIWIAELFIICVPIFMAAKKQVNMPFIEDENQWAKIYKEGNLRFTYSLGYKELKKAVSENIDVLLETEVREIGQGEIFYIADVYHSSDFNENYLDLKMFTYKKKTYTEKSILHYIAVDKNFLSQLFKHCGVDFNDSSPEEHTLDNQSTEESFSEI